MGGRPVAGYRIVASMLVAALWSIAAVAAARPLGLHDLQHSSWTVERGASVDIRAMTQGIDGFLVLATGDGVHRFDGVSFERLPSPPPDRGRSREVRSILSTRSGDLWVGFNRGGVAVYRRGRWALPAMPRPDQPILGMAEDRAGRIWVLSGRSDAGVILRDHGRWIAPPAAWRLPDQMYWSALVTRAGAIWLAGEDGVYVMPRGAIAFRPVAPVGDAFALAEAPDGAVWAGNAAAAHRLSQDRGEIGRVRFQRLADGGGLAFDRSGALWIAHPLLGILRAADPVRAPDRIERSGDAQGLSGAQGIAVLRDREGNIWAATSGGLDRFRATDLVRDITIPERARDGFLLFGDGTGASYFADNDSVYQLRRDAPARLLTRGIAHPGAVCRQADGGAWLGSDGRIDLFRGGRLVRSVALREPAFNFYGCAIDAAGTLWIAAGQQGVLRVGGGRAQRMPDFGIDTRRGRAAGMVADAQGRILAYRRFEGLWRYDGDRITRWRGGALDRIGLASVLLRDRDTVLIGGETGLARLSGDRFSVLDSDIYPLFAGIRALLTTRRGDTWITTPAAVLRVRTADLDAAFDHPGRPVPTQVLGVMDGVAAPIPLKWNLIEAADGRVGIAGIDRVGWIDPSRMTRNPLPPPVAITGLVANGRRIADPANLRLAAGTDRIEIDFTALGLARPDRVGFRYRLIGEDDRWIDPGARRQAFYTNLHPGHYVFAVTAANESGVWNRRGARLAIDIPPTFLQSHWFKALCALLGALLVWGLYRARMTFVTARLRNRLEARLAERERIARELHDTLLQGVQGLILRFQSVVDQIPVGQKARPLLDDALDRADVVLVEGRQRVREIRARQSTGALGEALVAFAETLVDGAAPLLRLTVEGKPRDLHLLVRQEVEAIAQEAIRNAVGHAGARVIDIAIGYHSGDFRLGVSDDGGGMPEAIAMDGRDGHFGIEGMRERAGRIGGRLRIASKPGAGTEVAFMLRASLAYRRPARYGLVFPTRAARGDVR